MKAKSKIKIVLKRKNVRTEVPADLMTVLKDVFYQHGGIQALSEASGVSRGTIGQTKTDGLATKETISAYRKGIAKLLKQAA